MLLAILMASFAVKGKLFFSKRAAVVSFPRAVCMRKRESLDSDNEMSRARSVFI